MRTVSLLRWGTYFVGLPGLENCAYYGDRVRHYNVHGCRCQRCSHAHHVAWCATHPVYGPPAPTEPDPNAELARQTFIGFNWSPS